MPTEEMGSRALPQPPEIDSRIVVWITVGFLLFVATVMTGVLVYLNVDAPAALTLPSERGFPQPALQTAPRSDLNRFETEQRAALSGYAWVDRGQGLVRIPIEDAMRIVAGRGDHGFDPLEQAPAAPQIDPGAKP